MPAALHDIELRREKAYAALAIDRTLLHELTPISSQLRMLGSKLKKRNLPSSPYYYLKCTEAPEARRVVELYYGVAKRSRDLIPIEAYCLAASVHPLTLLNIIVTACSRVSAQTSQMLAAITHPQVVEKTIERALTDDGYDDRVILHKATGFLPTPKAPQTNIKISQSAQAHANAQAAAPVIVAAPPPEATVRRLVDRFHEVRGLPPATAEPPLAALPESIGFEVIPEVMPKDADQSVMVPRMAPPQSTISEEEEGMDEDT